MRVLICGSRTWKEDGARDMVGTVIYGLISNFGWDSPENITIIEGAANGADREAGASAESAGCEVEEYPANWDKHGKAAGPLRNQQMLDEGKPELVIAFVDKPLEESRGTNNMVTKAKAAGLPVYVVEKVS